MELKNLESLKDELAYLEEAEELLQAIYIVAMTFMNFEIN